MDITRKLFRFAVVADTHVNERDDASTSPFQAGPLANDRARHVFQAISQMTPAPDFVIHLGDIVHPVPALPTFADAVARFKDVSSCLQVPLHLLPGNHDVGDKRVDWMPADQVCSEYLNLYRSSFGADYSAFDKGNLRFILINSLLINSGLEEEVAQREWLEQQVGSAQGKRVFAFMHYPPYIYRTDERSNYDNLDEPGRSWLLGLLRRPCVEAVFAGHVHNFWYDRIADAEFYMLPSTAFLRHDFTEFYRIAPSAEFGRSDVEKYGYFVVDVFENGHVAYPIRTMGQKLGKGEPTQLTKQLALTHPKVSTFDQVGVELRHPWTESMQITATGGVQEFGRKWARNDYPMLALWEMGVRLSKVPEMDLAEAESRERMRLLARLGHRFLVTTLGVPKEAMLPEPLAEYGVIGFEVNMTRANFLKSKDRLAQVRQRTGTQIFFSKILTYDASHYDGKHFSHFVKSGFLSDEMQDHEQLIQDAVQAGQIDGITVRIPADHDLPSTAVAMRAFAARSGCRILASLKLSSNSLATARVDDFANVVNTAYAMIFSKLGDRILYVFDTFMDVDRGYYPRNAFIDRRFNPRMAAKAFTAINAALSASPVITLESNTSGEVGLHFRSGDEHYVLCSGEMDKVLSDLSGTATTAHTLNLMTGQAGPFAEMSDAIRKLEPSLEGRSVVLMVRKA